MEQPRGLSLNEELCHQKVLEIQRVGLTQACSPRALEPWAWVLLDRPPVTARSLELQPPECAQGLQARGCSLKVALNGGQGMLEKTNPPPAVWEEVPCESKGTRWE